VTCFIVDTYLSLLVTETIPAITSLFLIIAFLTWKIEKQNKLISIMIMICTTYWNCFFHNVIGSITCTMSLALLRAQCHWLWYVHNVIGSITCTMSSRLWYMHNVIGSDTCTMSLALIRAQCHWLWYMHIGVQNSSNLTFWCQWSNL